MTTGTRIVGVGIFVIAGVWLAVSERVSAAAPKPQQVTVANMHIDPALGHTILPDGIGTTYTDYRLAGGCVHTLLDRGVPFQVFLPALTDLQFRVLNLLGVPLHA